MGLLPHRMVGGFMEGAARVGTVVVVVGCHMTGSRYAERILRGVVLKAARLGLL